jgi:hypothetical protein
MRLTQKLVLAVAVLAILLASAAGVTELEKSILVGRNGSFEASGRANTQGNASPVGGRFLHEGRLARGWFIVDNGGCLTERTRWTATPG